MKKRAEPQKTNAAIYIRVSTLEQVENLSLETQEQRCREKCQRNGWNLVQTFREEGQSAKTTKRDEFQRMLRFCKERKNAVGHLVVYDLSRFARNVLDQLDTERDLVKAGVRVESVMEQTDDTAAGKMTRNMHAVWNQYDNERRSERTVVGMTQAANAGKFPFKAPLGYINVSQHQGQNLIPDPKTAPLIKKAFELYATGLQSKAQVLKQLNAFGLTTRKGRPLSPQTFEKLLVNPIYAGWVVIPAWGLKAPGKFESLVTQQLFDTVQDVLQGKKIAPAAHSRNHPDFPLRIFVRCGKCGEPLTGAWSTGRKKKYAYYRCRKRGCAFINVRRSELEAEFIRLLQWLTPTPTLVSDFKNTVRSVWKQRQGDADAIYAAVQQKLSTATVRNEKLVNLFLDGNIDQPTYAAQSARLGKEIDGAEQELRIAESGFLDLEGVLAFAEKIITSPTRLWLESSLDQRQRLQGTFFSMDLFSTETDLEPPQVLYSSTC
jgi:DNA invertase Pin-like site-specific DNA recombinase